MAIFLRIFCCVFIAFYFTSSYACEVIDDVGSCIKFAKPATRIISLAPDITEILFAIGAGDQVVGVIRGSDYPSSAKNKPEVGSYTGLDLEKIIALHPDLIITWNNTFSRQLAVLKKLHIAVYTTKPHNLEDIPQTMRKLGCLAGVEKNALIASAQFNHRLLQLKQKYQLGKPVSVFYQIGAYGLITINKESWINQIITLCGGQNVFANASLIAPEVTWEAIITKNPAIVITGANNTNWMTPWQRWPAITAVKQGSLFTINPDLIERAGPRILNGAQQVCEYIDKGR